MIKLHDGIATEASQLAAACVEPTHWINHGDLILLEIDTNLTFSLYGVAFNENPRFFCLIEAKAHQTGAGCARHLRIDPVSAQADSILIGRCHLGFAVEVGRSLRWPKGE